nr:hypothetical protein [Tanacetum cinerariifolium]
MSKWKNYWFRQSLLVTCSNPLGQKNVDCVYLLWEDLIPKPTWSITLWHLEQYLQKQKKYKKKTDEPVTSPKSKTAFDFKGTRLKSKDKVTKPDVKKQPTKKTKAKGLAVLSKVALSKVEQIKLATKRSKKYFYISHASGSGDGVDTQSKVPDEQEQNTFGTNEGTDSEDEDDNDDDDEGASDDHDDDSDDERIEYDSDEIPELNLSNVDQTDYKEKYVHKSVSTPSDDTKMTDEEKLDDEETMDDEEDDEVIKELYDDVNVNLGNDDTEMTKANQGGLEQQNFSQESGFEQEEEDAHVTLTLVSDAQNADEPIQSSSVSSDFTSKFLNLENPALADNDIASMMETSAPHATAILEITSGFTTTTPPPPSFFNPLLQQQAPTITTATFTTITPTNLTQTTQFTEVVSLIPGIVDKYLASKIKEAMNVAIQLKTKKLKEEAQSKNQDFLNQVDLTMKTIIKDQVKVQVSKIMPKIKKYVIETLGAEVLVRTTNQPQTAYAVAASLSEFELKNILIDKSYLKEDEMIKTRIKTPPLDQTERQKEGNMVKMPSPLKIQEEPSHNIVESGMQQDQEFAMREYDEQLIEKEITKADCFKKPERPPAPDPDYNLEYSKGRDSSRRYSTSVTKTKAATYELKWIEDLVSELWSLVVFKRKRLMRTDELHKFSDGTLNDVRNALHDIDARIRMDYLPMRK